MTGAVYVAECLDADRARARAVWMGQDFCPPFEYGMRINRDGSLGLPSLTETPAGLAGLAAF